MNKILTDELQRLLKSLQIDANSWARQNFPDNEQWMPLVGAMEELGELAHAFLKTKQGIRGYTSVAEQEDAIGDIVIYLTDFCNLNEIDFGKALSSTWDKVVKRNWIEDPISGGEK